MDISQQDEEDGYCTFLALNRPAMLWGFPVKVLIVGFPALVTSAFAFPLLFGFWGILAPLAIAVTLVSVKGACEMDPRKPEKMAIRLRAFLRRVLHSKAGVYMLQGVAHEKYDRARIAAHFASRKSHSGG